uniref:Uncharacterized protein n=1 Tax=Toxocara canis TaxID=6265 RepID=A0A183U9J9_TOXCA
MIWKKLPSVREILNPVSLGFTRVGFEPTPPKRLVPKASALDHPAISQDTVWNLSTVGTRKSTSSGAWSDESGIRIHASEETGALNQRLRPFGHLANDISRLSP